MFEVDGLKAVELVGVNIAVSECLPFFSVVVMKMAKPLNTGAGAPNAEVPSLNWTVPAAPSGATCAMTNTKSPLWISVGNAKSLVVVAFGEGVGVGVAVGGTGVAVGCAHG